MKKMINIISRITNDLVSHSSHGSANMAVFIPHASVIQIQGNIAEVVRYVRVDNELIIYFQDGSIIKLRNYFSDPDEKSELVFESEGELTHVTFEAISNTADEFAPIELVAHTSTIESLAPFFEQGWDYELGLAAGLFAGVGGYMLSSDKSFEGKDEVIETTVAPTFIVTDDQGNQQGLLDDGALTDDNTPTFSGTGVPGATIQIKDASGNTIASTLVDSDGKWSVILAEQVDGAHTWSVVQINGNNVTEAGEISITISSDVASISFDTISDDNLVNYRELLEGLSLSGQTEGLVAGSALTVICNGKTYETIVADDGSWNVLVPTNDSQLIVDGTFIVTVTGQDAVGNQVSNSQNYQVDTIAPDLTINTIAGDDILNIAEQSESLEISGTSNAQSGQIVTVTLNGKTYQGIVGDDGRWSTMVPASDVGALTDGNVSISASVKDVAGNTSLVNRDVTVDSDVPSVMINTIAGDNVLNASELSLSQVISGIVTGAGAGSKVLITIGKYEFTTFVDGSGNWVVSVPAINNVTRSREFGLDILQDFGIGADGKLTIEVTVINTVGNSGSAIQEVIIDTSASSLSIEPIAEDNILNAIEKGQDLTINGSSVGLSVGTEVTVTLNHRDYTATINSDGTWSLVVSPLDLAELGNTNYLVTATATNDVGNTTSIQETLLVDTSLPVVTIDTVAGDDIINATEISSSQTISGQVSHASTGDVVIIQLGGAQYTATVQNDLSWGVELPADVFQALGDGEITISASVTNGRGNTGSTEHDITIDAELPGLRVDTIVGDDVVNALEHKQALIVSGTSSGLDEGSKLTVTIFGKQYFGVVLKSGRWSVGVPAEDVSTWPEGNVNIIAVGESSAGNPVVVEYPILVDLNPLAITIDSVTSDNIVNALEKSQPLTLSGLTSHVEAGQIVTISLNGKKYTALVDAKGGWSVDIPATDVGMLKDSDITIQASVTNQNGNSASTSHEFNVDSIAPTLTINTIATDDILNAAEQGAVLAISGSCDAEQGQVVTVSLNGKTYTTTVDNSGMWALTVLTADLGELADGNVTVSATVADKAGNETIVNRELYVDTSAPVVTIDTIAGDNVLNATEFNQAHIISGRALGASEGDSVLVTIAGNKFTTLVDASGHWNIGIPSAAGLTVENGQFVVEVQVTDTAGNTGSASQIVVVDTSASMLTIDTIAEDNILNAAEKVQNLIISGNSGGLSVGTVVTVTFNYKEYFASIKSDGSWSINIPPAELAALGNTNYIITASADNDVGNSTSVQENLLVDTSLPTVMINTVAGNDIINAAELNVGQVISGRVSNAATGDTVNILLGGQRYTAIVQDDLSWSVNVPSDVLKALGDGDITITASVTNGRGNVGSSEHDVVIDAQIPGLRIDTVAGDDVINSLEHGQALVITGSSTHLTAGDNITVSVNGKDYTATILIDGSWQVGVSAADVNAWPAGEVVIMATGESSAGNPVTITYPITVDLGPIAVSINSVTSDNVLNALEKGEALTLSGKTSNVEAGQIVTITLNGQKYTTAVQSDGSWSLGVVADDVKALKEGDNTVYVSVNSVNGNNASASHEFSVDSIAPTLTINTIANDDIVNAAEQGAALVISGSCDAEQGRIVTVSLGGKDYTAIVDTLGKWTLNVPAADLGALADGNVTVSATVTDKAGNETSVSRDITVDTIAPVVTINTIAGDNVLNAVEATQAQVISGTAIGVEEGTRVVVTLGSYNFTTLVDAAGNWSVGIPASIIAGKVDGQYSIHAIVTDGAGNSGSATSSVTVDTQPSTITINSLAEDNILNAVEKGQNLIVSGTSNELPEGTVVTVTLNGKSYTAKIAADKTWSLTISPTDLALLADTNYTIAATASDAVGNIANAETELLVDTSLPTVIINTIAGDNIVNAAEVSAGQIIKGRVVGAEQGDTVVVMLGGNRYTATVQDDLSWSVNLPSDVLKALGDGDITVVASVTNSSGNTGSAERDITIDAQIPGLRIDTVAGDDVINSIEHGQALVITGSSTHLTVGNNITVSINGKDYTATILADGSWQVGVSAADVNAWPEGKLNIVATGESSAGNPITITYPITVDLGPIAITINSVTSDNVLNALEKGQALTLSGETSNVEEGQTVTITLNGYNYTTTVQSNGSWSVDVAADSVKALKEGDNTVYVSVDSVNGNNASTSHEFSVDSIAPALTINTIATDDILNAAEQGAALAISGTCDAEKGQIVTVSLNGKNYTATVDASGAWILTVPAADLGALVDGGVTVSATVADKAGNETSVSRDITVDTVAPVVTINTIAGDNVLNAVESTQAQLISGSASNAVEGSRVVITIGSRQFTAIVDASGKWSVGIPASVISSFKDGDLNVVAAVTDSAGNTGSATSILTIDTEPSTITINSLAQDNVLNAVEKGEALTVSGTSSELSEGTIVTVTLNGNSYTALVKADKTWSLTIPPADLALLGEISYNVSATASDDVGNIASTVVELVVDTTLPTVIINTVAGDNVINFAELTAGQTIVGRVVNAEAGDTVVVMLGGNRYTAEVQADLSWSVNLPSDVLQALGDGALTVDASVTNSRGNTGNAELGITIDAKLPGLRIDTIAGDDVINIIEHQQALVINGSSSGLTVGSSVTITINGKQYAAVVAEGGAWQVGVPADDVSGWPAGVVNVVAQGLSSSGNSVSITYPVTVDLSPVAISINPVTSDNILNAAEKEQLLALSGTTKNVEEGQVVTVILDGKQHIAIVQADGSWSIAILANEVAALKEGTSNIEVSVSNVNGNNASASHTFTVDATAPELTINAIASDDILNAAEQAENLVLEGRTTAEAGQTVTITLNGKNYTATVQSDLTWSVTVPAADLATIKDGNMVVNATVADKAGNSVEVERGFVVDTTAPEITINNVAGDNIINESELNQALIVSGTVTGAAEGSRVVVYMDGTQFITIIDENGNWSVGIPSSIISAASDGVITITASITGEAGNVNTASRDVQVETTVIPLVINTIAEDNVLNAIEQGQALTISGSSEGLSEGTVVTVSLNGKDYTATTDAAGLWSLNIPSADLAKLGDVSYTITATATNDSGNTSSAAASLLVDTSLPVVTIDVMAGDNVLNAANISAGQTVTGQVSNAAAGDTVVVKLGGQTYTATVKGDLTWSVDVPSSVLTALGNGDLTIEASVTNGHGNTGSNSSDITIDANLPGLRVDTVAGDDVINSIEAKQALVITGSSSGITQGSSVTVTINGKNYNATVNAGGDWQVGILAADVGEWAAGQVDIKVTGESSAGNSVTINHPVTVDLTAVSISISPVATDNMINATEKGQVVALSGKTENVEAGQIVTITLGDKTYTATVQSDFTWSVDVPAADVTLLSEGKNNVHVSVTNVNGNGASAEQLVIVDSVAPNIIINDVAVDNILNAVEQSKDLVISGTSDAEAGQTLTLTLNGKQYTCCTVGKTGLWSVTILASDLALLADGDFVINASVTDKAGNSSNVNHNLLVDTTPPALTIDVVAEDDVLNAFEASQPGVISGTAVGAKDGQLVRVSVAGKTFTAVVDENGTWSIALTPSNFSPLENGKYTIVANITDDAGNSISVSRDITLDKSSATLTINDIAQDNVLNAIEKGQALTISGTSDGLSKGTVVTVNLNGKSYTATTNADGSWSLEIQPIDLAGLSDASYTITAGATNDIGNDSSAVTSLLVDTSLPIVIINSVASNNVLNATDVAAGQTISGQVSNAAAGDIVTVLLGGQTYTATVLSDLTWSVNVPSNILTALGDGALTIKASVTNEHGNIGSNSRDITIDSSLPGLRVDTIAGDDVINSIEAGQDLVITGSSSNIDKGSSVTITINGKSYSATVGTGGYWQVGVSATDVSAWPEGKVNVVVTGESSAGNSVTITHPVIVDLSAVSISISAISTDNVINSAEKEQIVTLSGMTGNVEAGQTVTITLDGKYYTATVQSDFTWSVDVTVDDVALLHEGKHSVYVSVTNANGNSASAEQVLIVDSIAPNITINDVAVDNILNATEHAKPLVIDGSSDVEAGQIITITVDGKQYTTTVGQDGLWSITVPVADIMVLKDGNVTIDATVTDRAGNTSNISHEFIVDTTPPTLTINVVAGDDIVNAHEASQGGVISGTAIGAKAGKLVKVILAGESFLTAIDASGNWSIGVPASFVSQLANGTFTIVATVTDDAGNMSRATRDIEVNTTPATLTINTIAQDNVLNAVEKEQALTINGTSKGLNEGTAVKVTFNGQDYTTTVQSDSSWSVTIPSSDLAILGDVSYSVTVTATDDIGNNAVAEGSLLVDTSLPTVIIDTVASDNIINATEVESAVLISGLVTNATAGDKVTVVLGGQTYTATLQNDLSWSVSVPSDVVKALGDGALTINASVTNTNGNTGSAEHEVVIDANIPGLRVNTVAGDDVVNSIEHAQSLIITGTSEGLATGSTINVVINGKTYITNILADGSWQAPVLAEDVAAWKAGILNILVTGESEAGNAVSINYPIKVDLNAVAISVDPVTADNTVNAAEKSGTFALSGSTKNVEEGQTVTVTLNGKVYTATVDSNGKWSVNVPAADAGRLDDGNRYLQVSVNNASGNGASATHEFYVDSVAPTLKINTIANDDIINAAEKAADLVISGTCNAEVGRKVTVSLNGKTYTGTVTSDGTWSVTVPTADLAGITDGNITVSANVSDKAGNGVSASKDIVVDSVAPTITINSVTEDNTINSHEAKAGVAISGTSNSEVGSKVVVTFNDRHYETTVKSDGTWSIDVPSNHLSGLMQGNHNITVKVTDTAGNTQSKSTEVAIVVDAPTLSIDTFAGDNYVNASEHELAQTISGVSNAVGQTVTVTLNGKTYTATVATDGTWSLQVPSSDVSALAEGQVTIQASVNGALGNSNTASSSFEVDLTPPPAIANVEKITQDTGVNTSTGVSENNSDFITSDNKFTISGSTTGTLAANDTLQVSLDGGRSWIDVPLVNGQWSLANTSAMLDGMYTYYFRVLDAAGNAGTVISKTVTVDTQSPDHSIAITGYEDDKGIYQSDTLGLFANGSYTDDQTVLLKGTLDKEISAQLAESGVIRIYNGSVLLGVATVNGLEWSFLASNLAEGSHSLKAVVVDLAGNEGTYSQEFVINVDLTAPTQTATIDSYIDNVDNATNNAEVTLGNNSQTNDTLPLLKGSLSAAIDATDTVRVYDGQGAFIGTAVVNGTSWSLQTTSPLSDGQHIFKVSVVDAAGNHGAYSSDFTITVDTTPPSQTVTIDRFIDDVDNGDYQTGAHLTGSHTNDTTPELQGTLSAALATGEVLRIYQNGKYIGNATVNADLTWSYLVDALQDGAYNFTAIVADAVGNEGQWSNQLNLTVDTIAPTEGSVTVNSLTTADATPTITGTVDGIAAGNRLQVIVDGVLYTHGVDDELTVTGNNWSLKIPASSALNANGTVDVAYEVQARIADLAGNAKLDSTSNELVILRDTTVVRSPGFDYLAELQPELLIRGDAGANEKLVVTIKNQAGDIVATFDSSLGQMTQLSTGNWTISNEHWGSTLLSAGTYTAFSEVIVTDGSGGQRMEAPIEFTVIEPETYSLASNHSDARVDDSNAKVFALADGSGYWVFWAQQQSYNSNYYNLMAEKYTSQGMLVAGSTMLISERSGQQNDNYAQYITMYDVYMRDDGSFSVFYSYNGFTVPYVQNYHADGTKNGSVIAIRNTLTYEVAPSYVGLEDGSYVLLYVSGTVANYNVYSQRYAADGTEIDNNPQAITSGSNQANGYCHNSPGYLGVPTGANTGNNTEGMSAVSVGYGHYAVLYMSQQSITGAANGANKTDMHLKIYDANTGSVIPLDSMVANTQTDLLQLGSQLIRLHDGSFVGVWASNHGSAGTNGTMDGFDVYSRRFKWDPFQQKIVALDSEEGRVNTSTNGVNGLGFNELTVNFDATSLVQGGYVVTWTKFTSASKSEVYTQTYDAAGNKIGGETLISVESPNVDCVPSVSALPDGGYIVSWTSKVTAGNNWGNTTGDIKTMVINSDGTVRGNGDTTDYPQASVSMASANNEVMTGTDGVNTLDGRGYTGISLSGGAGNDYLMIDSLNFASVNGGTGFDTLLWDSKGNLDLASVSNKVHGIEAIHLGDDNANALTLTLESVKGASDTTDVLVVYGGNTDSIQLTDSGWSYVGEQTWRGEIYQVYENANSTTASLWVQNGVLVDNSGAKAQAVELLSQGLLRGSTETDTINVTAEQQIIEIGNGGQDSLLFSLLDNADSLGGHTETTVNGFTEGVYNSTADADRVDISELLRSDEEFVRLVGEYTSGNVELSALADYVTVVNNGSSTSVIIDRDGAGNVYEQSTLVTFNGVQTDLESLLQNNQLII